MKRIKNFKLPLFLLLGFFAIQSCQSAEETKQDDVFSIQENGQQIFYSSFDKAFGDVYLGMPKQMVDSIITTSPKILIAEREYKPLCEFSKNDMLVSFYLRSDTILENQQDVLVDEIEDIISVRYGQLDRTYVSDLPKLGIAKETKVGEHKVYWGSHWHENHKYIALGVEPIDSSRCIWIWIFNTNLWNRLGEDKIKQEADNF